MHHSDAGGDTVGKCYWPKVLAACFDDKTDYLTIPWVQKVPLDEELVYRGVKE